MYQLNKLIDQYERKRFYCNEYEDKYIYIYLIISISILIIIEVNKIISSIIVQHN